MLAPFSDMDKNLEVCELIPRLSVKNSTIVRKFVFGLLAKDLLISLEWCHVCSGLVTHCCGGISHSLTCICHKSSNVVVMVTLAQTAQSG